MPEGDLLARVVVRADLSPSEDPRKVVLAVRNVVGDSPEEVRVEREAVSFVSKSVESLRRLKNQLRDRHVREAARRILAESANGESVGIMLNRQAAAAGVLVVCGSAEESPLGPIQVTVQSEVIEKVVEWLTAYDAG